MFTWVGAKFDTVLATYVVNVVAALMSGLAPIALTAMTLWVAMFGWAVLRGDVAETLPTFLFKIFKVGLVLAFALQSGVYVSNVVETANALGTGVATTFLPSGVDASTVTGPYSLLDKFNDDASNQVFDIMKEASLFRLDLLLAAAVFSIGSVAFLCIGLFIVTLSKLLLTFVVAIGPIFILSLAWRPTQRFFDSWLSMLLNAVVLTWFSCFALGLSTYMGAAMFDAILKGGGFLGGTFNVLGEAIRDRVLMILMAILCFQAPSLAAALTGGAAVHQGVQMVQNVLMVAGLHSVRSGSGSGSSPAGGTTRAGTGLPYAAGRATGLAAHAGTRFAGTMATGAGAVVTQGYHAARTAAYKLAALRGRA